MIEGRQQHFQTVWWEEDDQGAAVYLLDQSLLPQEVVNLRLENEEQVADAIVTLKVRGAPAIGVTAAFGMALALHQALHSAEKAGRPFTSQDSWELLQRAGQRLRATRPTAVNLFWAIERILRRAERCIAENLSVSELSQTIQREAQMVADEDRAACMLMGRYGATLIQDGDTLLTHCNAGALATAGLGTALAPIYIAHQAGKQIHVYVDETRPILQGARLTAWELQQEGIPLTLITDNMAGHYMLHGGIKAVFVGADRVAANGDVANKIGTYSVAVLARAHEIPFYVVAPRSTIDLTLSSGEHIPIEQRRPEEVTTVRGAEIAPIGVHVANPAFDVTPHRYITAIITEKGIARPPFGETLRQMCQESI